MCELDDVIRVAQNCTILHTLIARMQQNGDFRDETGGVDIISKFDEREEGAAAEATAEYEANPERAYVKRGGNRRSKVVTDGFENYVMYLWGTRWFGSR